MKVKRTLMLNSMTDLDLNNLGVHFSGWMGYIHTNGGQNGSTVYRKYFVEIYAEVNDSMINQEATAMSNESYAKENEVVLLKNQPLNVEIVVNEGVEREGRIAFLRSGMKPAYSAKANTGTRSDDWVTE